MSIYELITGGRWPKWWHRVSRMEVTVAICCVWKRVQCVIEILTAFFAGDANVEWTGWSEI